jgi:hypothetical protein
MNIQIRENVFETNSSSSHSLTITEGDILANNFPDEELITGQVTIPLKGFGREQVRLYKPSNKASYMLVDCLSEDFKDSMSESVSDNLREKILEDSPRAAMIIQAIEDYTGCEVFVYNDDCYIDHQSVGTSLQVGETPDAITHFLFSNSSITLGCDETEDPDIINVDTDIGSEPFGPPRRKAWDWTPGEEEEEPLEAPGL